MIRRRFTYHAPDDLAAVTALLADHGDDAAIIGGGTWVVPEMHGGARTPGVVVQLANAGLRTIARDGDTIAIGAAATYSDVIASAAAPQLLRTMAAGITGGAQVRNQGTVGGSACYANPASDVPAVLVALGATMAIASASGQREVAAADFFRGAFENCLDPGELLTEIRVPAEVEELQVGYHKLKLVAGSWPIVTASALVDATGSIRSLAVGGAAATPFAVPVDGDADGEAIVARVQEALGEPWNDVLASGDYRRSVAGVVAKRAVSDARGQNGANQ